MTPNTAAENQNKKVNVWQVTAYEAPYSPTFLFHHCKSIPSTSQGTADFTNRQLSSTSSGNVAYTTTPEAKAEPGMKADSRNI